jgi:hypothetical protein
MNILVFVKFDVVLAVSESDKIWNYNITYLLLVF